MRVQAITRYPVKSLPGEALAACRLTAGRGIGGDRGWGLARAGGRAQAGGAWQPKSQFHVLVRQAALAAIPRPDVDDAAGRQALVATVGRALDLGQDHEPRLVAAATTGFFDSLKGEVSILNLASLRALETASGLVIDPRRFRANIWLEGCAPWAEEGWVGADATVGAARLRLTQLTGRCLATHVNPDSAERDIDVLALLRAHFGHSQMGIYAVVTQSGDLKVGDAWVVESATPET